MRVIQDYQIVEQDVSKSKNQRNYCQKKIFFSSDLGFVVESSINTKWKYVKQECRLVFFFFSREGEIINWLLIARTHCRSLFNTCKQTIHSREASSNLPYYQKLEKMKNRCAPTNPIHDTFRQYRFFFQANAE